MVDPLGKTAAGGALELLSYAAAAAKVVAERPERAVGTPEQLPADVAELVGRAADRTAPAVSAQLERRIQSDGFCVRSDEILVPHGSGSLCSARDRMRSSAARALLMPSAATRCCAGELADLVAGADRCGGSSCLNRSGSSS
jgi:hypothetical protein